MVSIDSTSRKVLIVVPLVLLVAVALSLNFVNLPLGGGHDSKSEPPKPVKGCRTISKPGNYVLASDFGGATGLTGSCLVINSSHVTLNGSGHTIKGRGVTDTTGILVNNASGVSDVTIHSVRVSHWNRAIHLRNSSSATVRNVTTVRSTEGITVWNSSDVTLAHSRSAHNLFGLLVDNRSQNVDYSTLHYHDNQLNSTRGRGSVGA
ncbi:MULTISPECIES: NosD domain-containing protein [unclassified Haladaptatus]|uniref:NosD domain-containing protein n=1 Tax=unclassified Haladaptatus TaxID=2622732 RepID=UPI00209C55A3|nr:MULTISPECIES: NosD domain-containing protein [unclassified Haladaptatus]MCO8245861.1 copper-binding protein [Haladaptatus sp. AB643]MCO8256208.1 copper-binding protein [Haladaptatus sp. AB618]